MATQSAKLTTFPAFMRVDARKVAIFGNGAEAAAKARLVANTSAEISVYADAPEAELIDSLARLGIEPQREPYDAQQMQGATLVFAATGDAAQDRAIVTAAREQRIPANAVDQPDYCDFLTPALVNRAPVAIAMSSPSLPLRQRPAQQREQLDLFRAPVRKSGRDVQHGLRHRIPQATGSDIGVDPDGLAYGGDVHIGPPPVEHDRIRLRGLDRGRAVSVWRIEDDSGHGVPEAER